MNGTWLLNVSSPLDVPNLINGTTYYFRLQAKGENGLISFPSDQVSGTPRASTVTTGKLNDTGITLCGDYAYDHSWNHNNNIACTRTSDDNGDPVPVGQDGTSGRDVTHNDNSDGHAGFSFTKISSTGRVLPASATEWSCVHDNVTGLIWEVKTDDGGLHDKNWTYTWYESDFTKNGGQSGVQNGGTCGNTSACDTTSYVATVNAAGWCGYTDWRMPTVDELSGIASLDRYNPAIDLEYFPDTLTSSFWSSSPYTHPVYARAVSFSEGGNRWPYKREAYPVRLVRSR